MNTCPVCGSKTFVQHKILWPELIFAWELSDSEVEYINRQQGFTCTDCGNNLRTMALAEVIINEMGQSNKSLLEINTIGNLTPFLKQYVRHDLIEYPQYNMMDLNIDSDSYDVVVHSDTLEHIADPIKGLSECYRILKKGGACIFTVPIVVDRFSRSRSNLPKSYHGSSDDYLVHNEFGADVWKLVIKSGFNNCEIIAIDYPAAIVIKTRK